MERDRFKLNAAAIYDPRQPNQRVLVYNFNIPLDRLYDLATFEFVRQVLETDFPPQATGVVVPLYFQLSAVYLLVNSDTGEERIWTGSFHPRAREATQITDFRVFEPATFSNYAFENSQPQRVINKVAVFGDGFDSVWRFQRLISVVVSCQATLHLIHPIFDNHAKFRQHGHGGATKKNWKVHTTFFD
jgi:hypothetical protein